MSARLSALRFAPRGSSGWTTPPLSFGRILTLVLGPNGSGKTPILKGLAFALGYPVELPPDVQTRCESVELTLTESGNPVRVERKIGQAFDAQVVDTDGGLKRFSEEKGFSSWLIERLGIPERKLADRTMGVVSPYMSVLIPIFWVDQDLGWRNLYSPLSTHNFVKDQAV